MKNILTIYFYALLLLPGFQGMAQENIAGKTYTIGVVMDGPWEQNGELITSLRQELAEILPDHRNVRIPAEKIYVNNWSLAGVQKLNDRLLADPSVDLIVGLGALASQDLAARGALPKPVIAPLIMDPVLQGVPDVAGKSGVRNLNYLKFPFTLARDVEVFRQIVPFDTLVIISSIRYLRELPALQLTDAQLSQLLGVTVHQVFVDSSAEAVLVNFPASAQAVYIQPILHMSSRELQHLIEGINQRKLPSFTALGETEVDMGVMAGLNPAIFPRIARRIALNIRRILDGEEPAKLPVEFPAARRLFMNVKTIQKIGVSPKWSMLLEADLVDIDTTTTGLPDYSLRKVADLAITANLDIRAKKHAVSAGEQQKNIARARLLPQLDITVDGTQIDKEQASFLQPERTATAALTLSQVIFSEPALANVSVQKLLQASLESEFDQLRLDITRDAATAYLNYLRAQKILFILMDNLKITRTNLELARVREATGIAGPNESLRWETVLANNKIAVLKAQSGAAQAAQALNQILNRSMSERFKAKDVQLQDPELLTSAADFLHYLEDPLNFQRLSNFMVQHGLKNASELQQVEALMDAQKRMLTSSRLAFLLPTVSAFGRYSDNFYRSEGGASINIPGLGVSQERTNWSVGVQLSFPLFTGFSRKATTEKNSQELKQLEYQYHSVAEKLELNIRAQMENVKASYFGIQQSLLAAEAARKNYRIVFDGYSQGTIPIINLLDAQEAALQAEQVAANAYYDFFIDYMQMQRAINQFDFLLTDAERMEFVNQLREFMSRHHP